MKPINGLQKSIGISRTLLLMFLVLFLWLPSWLHSGTYYVDATAGDDSNTGTSTDQAWKTIAKVNASSFSPGDNILFKRGEIWRDTVLVVGNSGISGNVIKYGEYGSGDLPIISGSDISTSWTKQAQSGSDLTSSCHSYWYFEGNGNDEAGNNNLTANGGVDYQSSWSPQGDSSAFGDGGENDYFNKSHNALNASFPFKASPTNAFTFGGWIQTGSSIPGNLFMSYTNWSSTGFHVQTSSDKVKVTVFKSGGGSAIVEGNSALQTNTAYHIAFTWDSADDDSLRLYINGVKQDSVGYVTDVAEQSGQYFNVYLYNGLAQDEAFVASSSFTEAQIQDIYQFGLDGSRSNYDLYYITGVTEPERCFDASNNILESESSKGALDTLEFYWDTSGDDTLWVRADTTGGIEYGQRNYGVSFDAKDYITFDGIQFEKTNFAGIYGDGDSDNITIQNCNSYYNKKDGIRIGDTGASAVLLTGTVDSCSLAYNGQDGIILYHGIDGWTVKNCVVHNNCNDPNSATSTTAGIKLWSSMSKYPKNCVVEFNEVYDNDDDDSTNARGAGIWFDTVGDTGTVAAGGEINIARYNDIHDNGSNAMIIEDSDYQEFYYNLVYDNDGKYKAGILLSRHCEYNEIYNNTVYGNTRGIDVDGNGDHNMNYNLIKNNISSGNLNYELYLDDGGGNEGGNGTGNEYDNNCFGAESSNFIWYNGTQMSTYAQLEDSLTTYFDNNVETDPLLTNPTSDFTLQSGSPCIDAGTNVGLTSDIDGNTVPFNSVVDVGAYEYSTVTETDEIQRGWRRFQRWKRYISFSLGTGGGQTQYLGSDVSITTHTFQAEQLTAQNKNLLDVDNISSYTTQISIYRSYQDTIDAREEGTLIGNYTYDEWGDLYEFQIIDSVALTQDSTVYYYTWYYTTSWNDGADDNVPMTYYASQDTDAPDAGTADGTLLYTNAIEMTYTKPDSADADSLATWIRKLGASDSTLSVADDTSLTTYTIQLGEIGQGTYYWDAYDSTEIITYWWDEQDNRSVAYKDTIKPGSDYLKFVKDYTDSVGFDIWKIRVAIGKDSNSFADSSFEFLFDDSLTDSNADTLKYAYPYELAEDLRKDDDDDDIWFSTKDISVDLDKGPWADWLSVAITLSPPDTAQNFDASSPANDSLRYQISDFDATADSFRVLSKTGSYPSNKSDGTLDFAFGAADTNSYKDSTIYKNANTYYTAMFAAKNNSWTPTPNQDTVLVNGSGSTVTEVYPAADSVISGWWASTGSDLYEMVNETTQNGDDDYIASGNAIYTVWFHTTEDFNFSFSSITSVDVYFVAKVTDGSVSIRTRIDQNGNTALGYDQSITGTYTEYSQSFSENPETSSAWSSLAELNSLRFGLQGRGVSSGEYFRVTQCYVTVTYSP